MRVLLMHRDEDFEYRPELRDAIYDAMLSGDLLAIPNLRRNAERSGQPAPVLAPTGNDAVLTQDLELDPALTPWPRETLSCTSQPRRALLTGPSDPDSDRIPQAVVGIAWSIQRWSGSCTNSRRRSRPSAEVGDCCYASSRVDPGPLVARDGPPRG